MLVYLDDIMVYSNAKAEHLKRLETVLSLLEQHQLHAKLSKCAFAMEETESSATLSLLTALSQTPRN